MSIVDGFRIALLALAANKMRTVLTMLGIIIGVSAVITMLAIGQGAQQKVTAQFAGLGADILYVRPGAQTQGGVRSASGSAPTLTLEDGQAIAMNVGGVNAVAPETTLGSAQLVYQGQNLSTRIIGTTPSFQEVRNFHPVDGDFFSEQDVTAGSAVIVLGANVAQNLFGDASAVGQTVRVSTGRTGLPFRVIGVMEAKGGTGFTNQDDQAFIPVTTLTRKLQQQRTTRGGQQVSQLDVQVTDTEQMPAVMLEMSDFLRSRHNMRQDDFTVQNPQDILQQRQEAQQVFTILLGSVAGISLLVGGIGIMNIMMVSVTERTREIGIRKAVGARRQDILMQFLIEAITVSFLGGALGVGLGVLSSHAVDGRNLGNQVMSASVSPSSIIMAFAVSAVIGVFFGLYPASRAARLNPIQALRYE
jgi:putative ABC transport system permease protein